MREFILSTDSTADLPKAYFKEHEIAVHPLNYIMDGTEYGVILNEITPSDFYQSMREGKMPTTCASNPQFIDRMMREQVSQGYDVLHISFSSALSSSYNNAAICARTIMEEVEGSKIIVIDSLAATSGQALMVYLAEKLKEEGKNIDEIADWLEHNKEHMVHHFTVDDLHHLVRGGRLHKSAAIVGTALQLKPLLKVDDEGALTTTGKVRGRKKALKALVDQMDGNFDQEACGVVFIAHADCMKDAQFVADKIKEQYGEIEIFIEDMTPTIGAHTGSGCLVVSYFGNQR